jgi:2-isopropylmalate synthase
LESFALNSVSEGIEALATTRVVIKPIPGGPNESLSINTQSEISQRKFSGSGSDTDIITSSARAYLSALNKLLCWNMRRREQVEAMVAMEEEANGVGEAVLAGPMPVTEVSP